MSERNVYDPIEDRVLLRTEDVYQTEAEDEVYAYSDKLLSIVADFRNSGEVEGLNAQCMVGKSKRGEVACRIFARIDPQTGIIEAAGFKARGCLAMTGCASAVCTMIEGKGIEEALEIGKDDISEYVDGVPTDKIHALHYAACSIKALVGDFLIRDGAQIEELEQAISCDPNSIDCIMAEHCSYRQSLLEKRLDEEDELRAIAENNACAAAIDLIRTNTAHGKLTSKEDLAELVPQHLTLYAFLNLILSHLEENAERNPFANAGKDASDSEKKPSRFANRGVGIPAFKSTAVAPAEADPADPAETDVATEANSSDALANTPHVFDYSHPSAPDLGDDDELVPPEGYELVCIDGEWGLVKADKPKTSKPTMHNIDTASITFIKNGNNTYLYDSSRMADAYVRWAFLSRLDDPLSAFAYCVREESKTYPRPLAQESMGNAPFNMSEDEVEKLWIQAKDDPEYADIQRTEASNGDVYYFSTDHLSTEHAESLAEWESVGRIWNV